MNSQNPSSVAPFSGSVYICGMPQSQKDPTVKFWPFFQPADTQSHQWSNLSSPATSSSYPDPASSPSIFTLSRSNTAQTMSSDISTNSSYDEVRSFIQTNSSMEIPMDRIKRLNFEFSAPPPPPRPVEDHQRQAWPEHPSHQMSPQELSLILTNSQPMNAYNQQQHMSPQELSLILANSQPMNAYNQQQHMAPQHRASNRTCTLNPPRHLYYTKSISHLYRCNYGVTLASYEADNII
jgi:hypothetical protein